MDKSDFIWDIFQNYVRILGAIIFTYIGNSRR